MKEFNLGLDGNRMMLSRQSPTDDTFKRSRVGWHLLCLLYLERVLRAGFYMSALALIWQIAGKHFKCKFLVPKRAGNRMWCIIGLVHRFNLTSNGMGNWLCGGSLTSESNYLWQRVIHIFCFFFTTIGCCLHDKSLPIYIYCVN